MILGETYRALREEKGISISSLAGADISKSQISRFELGETEISVFKLLYLLEKIGTTFEEFLLACNHYKPAEFTIFMNTVQSSAYQHDIHLLLTLAEQEKQFFEETQSHYHRLNFILIKSVLSRLTQVKLAEDELAYLSDYLLTIENWGYYETLLLGNCSHSLPPDLLYLYTKDALEKGQRYTSIIRNKEALINLLLNSLQWC
ncbi:helix-turn-helix domain-containing protein [Streptococcus sp. 121]|uniref:helix-turn-helix domain-containing protein n=1 Tax=Streptococcus sp. 121 TaxID=2797637 RepID=UPI0018F0EB25|nr:Rgg/GadR/MutR family transcriptional regulator [Streptococcus sp. 121]MBJ6746711.1 helix-turn-helix domain-containing protein [Streptococcus sp. 121]